MGVRAAAARQNLHSSRSGSHGVSYKPAYYAAFPQNYDRIRCQVIEQLQETIRAHLYFLLIVSYAGGVGEILVLLQQEILLLLPCNSTVATSGTNSVLINPLPLLNPLTHTQWR